MATKPTVVSVKKSSDMPKGDHYAILEYDTVHTPGYAPEDPPDRLDVVRYYAYTDEDEWKQDVEHRSRTDGHYGSKAWSALVVKRPTIRTTVTVQVEH